MDIKVIKNNGNAEEYNKHKIIKVLKAAGLSTKDAQKLADTIDGWVQSQNVNSIPSHQIREKVINELEQIEKYKYAAGLYKWYEKIKLKQEKQTFN